MKHKWKLLDYFMLLFFFVGIGIVAYPYISRSLSTMFDQQYINYYQRQANKKNQQEMASLAAKQAKKNKKLTKEGNTPGTATFTKAVENKKKVEKSKDYFEQHTIGALTIPKINVKLPIFDETNDVLLQKGATLLNGTSIPIGGTATHSVLSAHRGLPEASLFDRLPELKLKDVFFIAINKETHAYQVDQIKVIEPTNISDLVISGTKDYVTLMTCTPYMVNTHRLIVRGHRIPYKVSQKMNLEKKNTEQSYLRITISVIIGMTLLISLIYFFNRRKKRKVT
ncbi:class C sortase [Enterococcus hermanniensis]|uniref:Sortase n=1 Tax=Enterococcus hermanniensis TaxID=249189 RepID=A0A1L8TMU6_9ENTE|nr:class C sortase [Enterococcus hermanniensis]OJG45636.1 sortase [Enterococcus hermanniensis]